MNNILIKVLNENSKYDKDKIINTLKIDLEHCTPEIFNGKRYINSLHKDDIFIYLNKNCSIIGILKGRKRKKDYNNLRSYESRYSSQKPEILRKTSAIIIRIPGEQLTYEYRYNKKYSQLEWTKKRIYEDTLYDRLVKYRVKKSEEKIQIKQLAFNTTKIIIDNLYNENFLNYMNLKNEYKYTYNCVPDILGEFSKYISRYVKNEKENISNLYNSNCIVNSPLP